MQTNDLPRIGVLGADPAAVTQFLRRVQALGADPAALLPLSPAAVPDCEPYLCGTSTQSPLPKLRAAAEVLAASGCTVIAAPDSAGVFCEEITAAVGIPTLGVSGPALQPAVAADLVERGLGRLPRRARIPERRHRLRVRDRVGRVHVHGRESCVRELRHRLRDLRVREIDARTRAVADRLHHGLIPLRRRNGGVDRRFGLRRRLLPAGRQQRSQAQQKPQHAFHAHPSHSFCKQCTRKNSALQISPHLLYCRRWMP